MEREILFRGKLIYTNDWVYGHLVKFNDDKQKKQLGTMIYVYEDNKYYEVIPKTIEQYIGIKDQECVKIFEKDIYRITNAEGSDDVFEVPTMDYANLEDIYSIGDAEFEETENQYNNLLVISNRTDATQEQLKEWSI